MFIYDTINKNVLGVQKMSRYWQYEIVEGKCNISFVTVEDLETKLSDSKELEKAYGKEVKEQEKSMVNAKTPEEKTKYTENYLVSKEKYIENKRDISKYEEYAKISKRNAGMSLIVERLKDLYSRKEAVSIVIYYDGLEDGKIISTIMKINEDVYRLEEYGIYLTAPYYDKLAEIIKDVYFDLVPQEKEYIENEVSVKVVERFYEICLEEIEEHNQKAKEEDKITMKGKEYYVPVKLFKEWYVNSSFKRYSITELKEALSIYGYARTNPGRNDLTVTKIGKVVCLKVPNEK